MTFLIYWLLFGLIQCVGTFSVETILAQRNPEALLRLKKSRGDKPTHGSAVIILVIIWPILSYFLIRASAKNLSLVKYFLWVQEEESKKKLSDFIWVKSKNIQNNQVIYLLMSPYLQEGKKIYHLTHMIFQDNPSKVGLWRLPIAQPDPVKITKFILDSCEKPDQVVQDLDKAKKICEEDSPWLSACAPGKEHLKRTIWNESH